MFCLSVDFVKSQLSSELMLLPCEKITPPSCPKSPQLTIELPATMVFFTRTVEPGPAVMIPPPSPPDLLEAIVEFRTFMLALAATTPPPDKAALLPLIVLFVMLARPLKWETPPINSAAELPDTVLSVMFSVPFSRVEGQSLCLGHECGALRVIERVSSDPYTWFS